MSKQFVMPGFEKPPRAKPRVIAHMADAGENVAFFICGKCGWESGWIYDDEFCVSNVKRGIPCETCNSKEKKDAY